MPKDLRSYIRQLEKLAPSELLYINKEVDSNLEATAVCRKLELQDKLPMVIFKNPKAINGSRVEMPLIFNVFATRRKLAMALGLEPNQDKMELSLSLYNRYKKLFQPEEIVNAPVQQVIKKGDKVNLEELPIPVHHAKDGGPYILGGSMITKDMETGAYNLAMIRCMVKSCNTVTVHAEPHHHTGMNIKKYRDAGKPTPFAIVIGHHPSFYLGSLWEGPYGRNEFEIAGAAMQEPLRLVPSVTYGSDLMVPADAEIIIEGYVFPDRIAEEGPIGEHTRYYKTIRGGKVDKRYDPLAEITAITHRKDAYYQSCWIGHTEHGLIGAIPKEAVIYEKAKATCPGLKAVHLTPAGVCRYLCYLSLDQRVAGEAKDAILAAFISDWHIKYAIAVDTDIDIFNDKEVLWAVSTRVWAEKDVFQIRGCMGASLDPTTSIEDKKSIVTRVGIDATKPFGEPFSEVCEVDLDILNAIKVEDYL